MRKKKSICCVCDADTVIIDEFALFADSLHVEVAAVVVLCSSFVCDYFSNNNTNTQTPNKNCKNKFKLATQTHTHTIDGDSR